LESAVERVTSGQGVSIEKELEAFEIEVIGHIECNNFRCGG